MATKNASKKGDSAKTERKSPEVASGSAILIAKPTVTRGNGTHETIYDDSVKEVVALSENDSYARKIDNGPLSESRGKDVWQLHTTLRAMNQIGETVEKQASAIKTAASTIDEHLHADTVAITSLVERHGASLANRIESLAKATAGTEENLRTQTNAFSKAVEELLLNVQTELDRKIAEFRDDATRLIDKRFNQVDVTFAAIRADQEILKALLTDIIKDRLGRAEPRGR